MVEEEMKNKKDAEKSPRKITSPASIGSGGPLGSDNLVTKPSAPVQDGEEIDQPFSQKNVNNSVTEDYEHQLVTIEPSEMELEKAEAAR